MEWVDEFTERIAAREYDSAREVLRSALAKGANQRLSQQYSKVLEDFLHARDEAESPTILGRFGACVLRQMGPDTGRGLSVASFVPGGGELWRERPLMYVQSPCSRQCVQTCAACLSPVGSFATQLAHMGLPVPQGAEKLLLGDGKVVPCAEESCREVFCSEACRHWAATESPHAILCVGHLGKERWSALQSLENLSHHENQEHLLLLAHGIAAMALALQRGQTQEEVLHRYAQQFAAKPWDVLAEDGNGAGDEDTPERRRQLVESSLAHLRRLFEGEESAAPFLDEALLSNLLGTFELVNMCVALHHPLNLRGEEIQGLLSPAAIQRLSALQRGAEDEDDDTDEEGCALGNDEASCLQRLRNGTLFANIIGTSLCEALAFTNHCCLPNVGMDFAVGDQAYPGLWLFCQARRPLLPGDEVLMTYVPSVVGQPWEVRQRRMQRFGFHCRCRSCITDELLAKEGDTV